MTAVEQKMVRWNTDC